MNGNCPNLVYDSSKIEVERRHSFIQVNLWNMNILVTMIATLATNNIRTHTAS